MIFAGLGAIYRDNYPGINPDRTTTHLPTLRTGTGNQSSTCCVPRHSYRIPTLYFDSKEKIALLDETKNKNAL